jgi:hypothetical protein
MSIKGFTFNNGELEKYDYNSLDNAPCYSEYKSMTDILEVKEYKFVDISENIDGMAGLMLELTSLPPVIAGTPYNFAFGSINEQITFEVVDDEGALMAGNKSLIGMDADDTTKDKTYLICIMGDAEEGLYQIVIYTTEPAGTYLAGISYVSDNVPLILDGTYTFGRMGGE